MKRGIMTWCINRLGRTVSFPTTHLSSNTSTSFLLAAPAKLSFCISPALIESLLSICVSGKARDHSSSTNSLKRYVRTVLFCFLLWRWHHTNAPFPSLGLLWASRPSLSLFFLPFSQQLFFELFYSLFLGIEGDERRIEELKKLSTSSWRGSTSAPVKLNLGRLPFLCTSPLCISFIRIPLCLCVV